MYQSTLYIFIGLILSLLVIDYRQTLDIKNHDNMYEINPILGKHPSDLKITIYFLICSILFVAVSLYAHNLYNISLIIWLSIWAAMEIWAVQNNISIGLKV